MDRAARSFVVFSSVEALLLDPSATAFDRATPVVELLEDRGVPLVLCSGRTRAELEYIQQSIGIDHPFICEHGGAAFVKRCYFQEDDRVAGRAVGAYRASEFGRPYREVVETLHRTAARIGVEIMSFSEMSVSEVAAECGLPLMQARLAKLRDYDEAFRVIGDDPAVRTRLCYALQRSHLGCVNDGRFDFAGAPVDIGIAAQWLSTAYRRTRGPVVTIGVGDRLYHQPLLQRVDVPLVVRRGDSATTRRLMRAVPRVRLLTKNGDASGLADALAEILERPRPIATAS